MSRKRCSLLVHFDFQRWCCVSMKFWKVEIPGQQEWGVCLVTYQFLYFSVDLFSLILGTTWGSVKTSNDKWLVVTSSNIYCYQFWLFLSVQFITGGIWFGHDKNSITSILSIPPGNDGITWWCELTVVYIRAQPWFWSDNNIWFCRVTKVHETNFLSMYTLQIQWYNVKTVLWAFLFAFCSLFGEKVCSGEPVCVVLPVVFIYMLKLSKTLEVSTTSDSNTEVEKFGSPQVQQIQLTSVCAW